MLVNNKYNHIADLESLSTLLQNTKPNIWLTQEEIDKLIIVAKTTHNSHYSYAYMLSKQFQDPENHVDIVFKKAYIAEYSKESYNKFYGDKEISMKDLQNDHDLYVLESQSSEK
jgi:hypothetical protein